MCYQVLEATKVSAINHGCMNLIVFVHSVDRCIAAPVSMDPILSHNVSMPTAQLSPTSIHVSPSSPTPYCPSAEMTPIMWFAVCGVLGLLLLLSLLCNLSLVCKLACKKKKGNKNFE